MNGADLHRLFVRDFSGSQAELSFITQQLLGLLRPSLGLDAIFVSQVRDRKNLLICVDQCHDFSPNLTCGEEAPEAALVMQSTHIDVPIRNAIGDISGHLGCLARGRILCLPAADMRLLRATAELISSHRSVMERLAPPQGSQPHPAAAEALPLKLRDVARSASPRPPERPIDRQVSQSIRRSRPGRGAALLSAPLDPAALPRAVATALTKGRIAIDFQPICKLATLDIVGYEGLARFPDFPDTNVQTVFESARACGLGCELEMQAAHRIIDITLPRKPSDGFIALNLSNSTLLTDTLQVLYERGCRGLPRDGYIIEVSEAEAIENFTVLREALVQIRAAGLKLAIDDVGAGQSGLRHILLLEPDMIKIDKSVTAELVERKASRAMIAALTSFGEQTDCDIVAEGIETVDQLRILRDLGTPLGQGFLLGRPCALPPISAIAAHRSVSSRA